MERPIPSDCSNPLESVDTADTDIAEAFEIWRVYVAAQFQKKGNGKSLLDFAEQRAKEQGYKKIVIWAFTALSNGKASATISFLRTFGFITVFLMVLPRFLQITEVWLVIPIAELLTLMLTILPANLDFQKGIRGMVMALKELNIPIQTILEKVQEKYGLSLENAKKYI